MSIRNPGQPDLLLLVRETIAALEAEAAAAAESHELLDDLETRVTALTETLESRTADNAALRNQVGWQRLWRIHADPGMRKTIESSHSIPLLMWVSTSPEVGPRGLYGSHTGAGQLCSTM